MCGIVGFVGDFPRELLSEMNRKIAHRGPDDSGEYYNSELMCALGHRRLSIIDLSAAGHQPMWDINNEVVIVFNGEIYNYKELKIKLEENGFKFKSSSDTEVLLNLYKYKKEKMFDEINGIYSFAIWDTISKELLLARDPMGVKPLYYYRGREGIIFSSELKAILQYKKISKEIDFEAVHYYNTYLWAPTPFTMLKSVRKMEPGSFIKVTEFGKNVVEKKYYCISDKIGTILTNTSNIVSKLDSLLNSAVVSQLIADVPVGAFLSGGLDSTSIVSYAIKKYAYKMECFTVKNSDKSFLKEGLLDDLPYAMSAAEFLNVHMNVIEAEYDIVKQLPEMVYCLDEPQADIAPILTGIICKLAKEMGIKVLLSGAGGDDIFSGYRRHMALQMENLWGWLPLSIRKKLATQSRNGSINHSLVRRIKKAFNYADMSPDERICSYFHWITPENLSFMYSNNMKQYTNSIGFSKPLMNSLAKLPKETTRLNKMLFLDMKHFLIDHNLNYTDKMSMAHGVEVRVPLLDKQLVEYAFSIPDRLKQHGKVGKWIFRRVMSKKLPDFVINRPKTGFGGPVRKWVKNDLNDLINELLSKTSIENRGIYNYNHVQQMIDSNKNGTIDIAYPILSLLCVEMWCRKFIDG